MAKGSTSTVCCGLIREAELELIGLVQDQGLYRYQLHEGKCDIQSIVESHQSITFPLVDAKDAIHLRNLPPASPLVGQNESLSPTNINKIIFHRLRDSHTTSFPMVTISTSSVPQSPPSTFDVAPLAALGPLVAIGDKSPVRSIRTIRPGGAFPA